MTSLSTSPRRSSARLILAVLTAFALALVGAAGPVREATAAAARTSVTILVTTRSGAPAGHVRVTIGSASGHTGADGRVTLRGLRSGERTVELRVNDGDEGPGWSATSHLRLRAGSNGVKKISPASLAVLTGKVTYRGRPVAKAAVTAYSPSSSGDGVSRRVTTDAHGRYSVVVSVDGLGRPAPVQIVVRSSKKGTVDTVAPGGGRAAAAKKYSVTAGHAKKVDVRLATKDPSARGTITATITGPKGKPVSKAFVRVVALDRTGAVATDRSSRRGRVARTSLVPGKYRLEAWNAARTAVLTKKTVKVRGGGRTTALGKVALRTATAVVTATATRTVTTPDDRTYGVTLVDSALREIASTAVSFTGSATVAAREVRLKGIAPGSYRLVVQGLGSSVPVVVPSGGKIGAKTVDAGNLVVPQTRSVRFDVTNAQGAPVGWSKLYVFDQYRTDRIRSFQGGIDYPDLAPGSYTAVVVPENPAEGSQPAPVTVVVPASGAVAPVAIALGSTATLKGTVKVRKGKAVGGIKVTAVRADLVGAKKFVPLDEVTRTVDSVAVEGIDLVSGVTDRKGRYRLTGLTPGVAYRIFFVDTESWPTTYRDAFYRGSSWSRGKVVTPAAGTTTLRTTTVRG